MSKHSPDSYRQGDVYIEPIADIPTSAAPVKPEDGRAILARGEATGHHHSFAMSERVSLFREDGTGGGLFMLAASDAPANLEHQEHHTIPVAPGRYRVIQQVTYTPAAIRRVED